MKTLTFLIAGFLALPALAADAIPAQPQQSQSVVYSVWAFHAINGQWIRDESHCWTTTDPARVRTYAKEINAVPGWCATTNCPPQVARIRNARTCGPAAGYGAAIRIQRNADGGETIHLPFATVTVPPGTVLGIVSSDRGTYDSSATDFSPTYDDGSAPQQPIATQDMINQQQMNNNVQDMINTQNFINTENMINAQNAANAMNP